MALRWTVATLGLALLSGLSGAGEQSNAARFVGTWRITRGESGGMAMPAELLKVARVTFAKDGKTALALGDKALAGGYKWIGPGKIDISLERPKLDEAIYKFDGKDKVTICVAEGGGKRPTEYSAAAGSHQVILELTRAKAGEEKLSKEELEQNAKLLAKLKGALDSQSSNNLKMIGLAFHNYHDSYKAFPLHAIYSSDGKPLLSWRVAILPYIDEIELYKEFKLDEPWDSANNMKLIKKMPKFYAIPGHKDEEGMTHYQVITGPGTPFDGNKKILIPNLVNGTSNTILAVEAKTPVIWSKPEDLTLPADKNKIPALGVRKDSILLLLFDASVRAEPEATPALRKMMLLKGAD
jgi:uncharacterized protein (TIGR03067 family)